MPGRNSSVNTRLLSKVSSLYYERGLNQQEIADRLHLSRPKVSRLLKEAREEGIVQITVVAPETNHLELENEIEKRYGLQEVLLVESEKDHSEPFLKKQVGMAAAEYLLRTVSDGDIIGVSWGTTLQAMVDAMQPMRTGKATGLHVVQALGGVGPPEAKAHASDISRRLARQLGASLTMLPAPGIVGSGQAKKVLQDDRQVRQALDLFSRITTLCVGIGALKTNTVLTEEAQEISPKEYEEILQSEAVGDIALRFFDAEGREVPNSLQELLIGISLPEIRAVDTVVGIAAGPEKEVPIRGALKGGLIDVLITDSQTGERLV